MNSRVRLGSDRNSEASYIMVEFFEFTHAQQPNNVKTVTGFLKQMTTTTFVEECYESFRRWLQSRIRNTRGMNYQRPHSKKISLIDLFKVPYTTTQVFTSTL